MNQSPILLVCRSDLGFGSFHGKSRQFADLGFYVRSIRFVSVPTVIIKRPENDPLAGSVAL